MDLLKKQIIMLRSLIFKVRQQVTYLRQHSIIDLATTAAFNTVENKKQNVSNLMKKNIMMKKYQIFRVNIEPYLIIVNLGVKYLMPKIKEKELFDKSDISGFI